MTYYDDGSYRLAVGLVTAAVLDDEYEIEQLERQPDQPLIVDWSEPLAGSDVYSDDAEIVTAMDGSQGGQGGGEFTWYLGYLTPGMFRHLLDIWFDGDTRMYTDVTAMTFDRGYGWRVVHARLLRPQKATAEAVGDGFTRVPFRFIRARPAPDE